MKFKVLALFCLFSIIFSVRIAMADPTILGFVAVPDDARGIDVSGSYAYVAGGYAGLHVIDISDPANPTIVGSVDTPGHAFAVSVSGSYAYVADRDQGLQVIDISDPVNPTIVGSIGTPDHAVTVDVSGSYAYVAGYTNGLLSIDISDPQNPIIVGSDETPSNNSAVYVSGSYAYVADGDQGLLVIDISDPANPTIVGSVATPEIARGVYVCGSHAYVADDTGFYVIDITNPAEPIVVGSYYMAVGARDVFVAIPYAYAAGMNTGLNVIDIQDPTDPTFVSQVGSPPYSPRGIDVSGAYAYVADYHSGDPNGIYVIDISEYHLSPPIGNVGSDVVVFDIVTLDGSESNDSDGTITSFEWLLQHREDPNNNITAEGMNPTISGLKPGFYDVVLTVTDNDGLTGTDNMLLAAAGSCNCVASTMHIQSIIAGIIPASKNWKYGHVMVTVFDDCGNPVSAAGVTGTFTGDFTGTLSGTTGTDGIAIITTSVSVKKPSYEFCVEGVSHSSLTYDSSGNVETCRSK